MSTGKQLRAARDKLKLSAERVAKRIGVSVNTIYAWESGTSSPRDPAMQKKLHELLGLIPFSSPAAAAVRAKASRRDKETKAQSRDELLAFFNLLAFFTKDQARKSTTLELLIQAQRRGLTVENLISMLGGAYGP